MITKDKLLELRDEFDLKSQEPEEQSRYRDMEKLQRKFVSKFPLRRIRHLSLVDYATCNGNGRPDSFCSWVEKKTKLGSIRSRNLYKFGVFFDKNKRGYKFKKEFESENDAIIKLRERIARLIEAGRTKNLDVIREIDISLMFKGKILFLYYPDQYLNVFSEDYVGHFLGEIGLAVLNEKSDVLDKRQQLLNFKAGDEVMSKWTIYQFMRFLGFALGHPKSRLGDTKQIADIKKIMSSKAGPTTQLAEIEIRLGHGKFGLAVRELWNHRCSVTGSSTMAALEASHIKSWADSNDTERLDPNNGLLLTANLHKLFDAGLISFEDSGKMRVSSTLSQKERTIFGVTGKKLSKKPSTETANYLSYHRTKFLE